MSIYMNKAELIGRIGKRPVIAKTNDDQKIAKFSVATSEVWKDKITGERKEKTEWHRIVIYNSKTAEFIEEYAEEGTLVYVEGKIKSNKWVDAQGVERSAIDIVVGLEGKIILLERKSAREKTQAQEEFKVQDDDIPF